MKITFHILLFFCIYFISSSGFSAFHHQPLPNQGWQELTIKLVSLIQINCFDQQNGEIDVMIFGGKKPYHIQWTKDGQAFSQNEDITDLAPGKYEISVEDSRGKTATKTYFISAPKELKFQEIVRRPLCNLSNSTGTIILKPQGGTPPYRYEIYKNGELFLSIGNNRVANLPAGRYDVTLIDAAGCRSAKAIFIECR